MSTSPKQTTAQTEKREVAIGIAAKLEQLDYAAGVLVGQGLMLQKMIDELRREILAREVTKDG